MQFNGRRYKGCTLITNADGGTVAAAARNNRVNLNKYSVIICGQGPRRQIRIKSTSKRDNPHDIGTPVRPPAPRRNRGFCIIL